MYRLWVFLFALFAGVVASAALLSPANTLYFIVVLSRICDSTIKTVRIVIEKDIEFHCQVSELVARGIDQLPSGQASLATAYLDFLSRSVENSMTSSNPTSTSRTMCLQPLSTPSMRREEAWPLAFVLLVLSGRCIIFTFVPCFLRLVSIRRVFTDLKQIFMRTFKSAARPRISLEFDESSLLFGCLKLIALVVVWASITLFNFAVLLVQSARSAMASGPSISTQQQSDTCHCKKATPLPSRPSPPEKRSFADPAVVERNTRINQLELELQEWRQLMHFNNMERAREEHRLVEHNATLERTNAAQSARIRDMNKFHQSIGLTSDARATIRELKAQREDALQKRDDALEQGRKREAELFEEAKKREELHLGEVQKLKGQIKELSDPKGIHKAYVQEVNKWKYIARESITAMKKADSQLTEIQKSLPVNDGNKGIGPGSLSARREHVPPNIETNFGGDEEQQDGESPGL